VHFKLIIIAECLLVAIGGIGVAVFAQRGTVESLTILIDSDTNCVVFTIKVNNFYFEWALFNGVTWLKISMFQLGTNFN